MADILQTTFKIHFVEINFSIVWLKFHPSKDCKNPNDNHLITHDTDNATAKKVLNSFKLTKDIPYIVATQSQESYEVFFFFFFFFNWDRKTNDSALC